MLWLFEEGRLKEKSKVQPLKCEQKTLATLSPEQVARLLAFKPQDRNEARAHMVSCVLLDCGLRIAEALSLSPEAVDLDNLCLRVNGKGSKERLARFQLS